MTKACRYRTSSICISLDGVVVSAPSASGSRVYMTDVHSLVLVVDNSLDVDNLVDLIKTRITDLKHATTGGDSGRKYFPRFTQCLVRSSGGALVWVNDPSFVLSKHVVRYGRDVSDQSELEALLQSKCGEGLPVDQPLWQLVIAKGEGQSLDTYSRHSMF